MTANPLATHPIPEAVRPFLADRALKALSDAVEEATRVRAAYVDATRLVRALRDDTRAVEKADRAAFAAALRKDANVDQSAVKQGAEEHQRTITAADARRAALAEALADAERDLRRAMRAHGPELLSAIAASEAAARGAVAQALSDALAALAHLDQVRAVRNWVSGHKGAVGQFFLDERRLGAGPQPVSRLLAEMRQLLAGSAPTAATKQAEVDDDAA